MRRGRTVQIKTSLKSTHSYFGERFRDGQYSLASFLFAVSSILTVPPCPMESTPLYTDLILTITYYGQADATPAGASTTCRKQSAAQNGIADH